MLINLISITQTITVCVRQCRIGLIIINFSNIRQSISISINN